MSERLNISKRNLLIIYIYVIELKNYWFSIFITKNLILNKIWYTQEIIDKGKYGEYYITIAFHRYLLRIFFALLFKAQKT